MRVRTVLVVVLSAGALVVGLGATAAAGGGGGGWLCSGFGEGGELVMRDNCFEGTAHYAEPGSVLRVRNLGSLPHTFTAVDGSFDSGQVAPGGSFEHTVGESGITRVYCTLHGTASGQGMAGVLIAGDPSLAGAAGPQAANDLNVEVGLSNWLTVLLAVAALVVIGAAGVATATSVVRGGRRGPVTGDLPLEQEPAHDEVTLVRPR